MGKVFVWLFVLAAAFAFAAYGEVPVVFGNKELSVTPPKPIYFNLVVSYAGGCEDGFGSIAIELQPGLEFKMVDIECGKIIEAIDD